MCLSESVCVAHVSLCMTMHFSSSSLYPDLCHPHQPEGIQRIDQRGTRTAPVISSTEVMVAVDGSDRDGNNGGDGGGCGSRKFLVIMMVMVIVAVMWHGQS